MRFFSNSMSTRKNATAKSLRNSKRNLIQGGRRTRGSTLSNRDNALLLRPEYLGQPVVSHRVLGIPIPMITTVTTGVYAVDVPLLSTQIQNFSTRFAGYLEYRLVKVKARTRMFSSINPGLLSQWFSEDNAATPTATTAQNSMSQQFSISSVEEEHDLTYVPHDPAQQIWTLVASGNPSIGNFKVYTDNGNYGAPIAVTTIGIVQLEYTAQFRGFA